MSQTIFAQKRMDKLSVLVELFVFQRRGHKEAKKARWRALGCNQSAKCHQEANVARWHKRPFR